MITIRNILINFRDELNGLKLHKMTIFIIDTNQIIIRKLTVNYVNIIQFVYVINESFD